MKYFSKFILWLFGWKTVGGIAPEPKCIILGVPHTSQWDFVISSLYYRSVGGKANILVNKKFFVWPLRYIVDYLGGIPIDTSKGASAVKQIIAEFKNREQLHLAIAPEGTRKPNNKWKGGFYTIAKAANIPVYYGFFDWGKKEVGFYEKVELTDDMNADLKKVRQWYKDKGVVGKHPEKFNYGNDLE